MNNTERILTPEQAQQAVLEHIRPLGPERVPLLQAQGRVLAQDVTAHYDIPPCDNSAMDGFAVRFADVESAGQAHPVELQVIEDIPAGRVGRLPVGPGQASRIMTGAPLPGGADTVVRVEFTRAENAGAGGRVRVLDPEACGANVRHRGEDLRCGTPAVDAGTVCGPAQIGALAALQHSYVTVRRRPRIAILSTGDELVEVDEPLGPGRIVNCNSLLLAALAMEHGAEPVVLPIARDTESDIRGAVETALTADFVVSSGGVSVGEYDFVRQALEELEARTVFWRVSMKPGKPLFFCHVQGRPYFGLPGNPVSSLTSFLQFVRPAIRRAAGHPDHDLLLPESRATLEGGVGNPGGRRQYLRAQLRLDQGHLKAAASHRQGSHMLSSVLGSNGFVVLEADEHVAPGEETRVQIFGRVL